MEWNKLKVGKIYAFGFLVIDVCQSSKYGDTDKQQIFQFLEKFAKDKAEKFGGMQWHWAGDGGEYGFLEECDSMVQAAEDILIELHTERYKNNIPDFSIRICLHSGMAKWAKDLETLAGAEYSWICKLEKTIGIRDSIVITDAAYGLLADKKLRNKFRIHTEFIREKDQKIIKTYIYDPLSSTSLLDIAKSRYEQEEKFSQIARKYNVTDHQVQCLLDVAEIKKIVEKKITVRPLYADSLEQRIRKEFNHLKKVKIIDYKGLYIKEEIAKVAADEARNLGIGPGSSIAISCGTTIMELAKNLEIDPANIKNVNIYPLLITMTAEMEEVSPAGIVSFLTRVFPESRGYAAQFPEEEKDVVKAKKRKEIYAKDCNFLLKGSKEAKYMFTGLGQIGGSGVTHSFNVLIKDLGLVKILKDDLRAVGELCYQPYTIEGELLMDRPELDLLKANIIYIDLKELQKKVEAARKRDGGVEIFSIAGGKEKYKSVLGGLRAKIFNNLITDIETAEFIVKNL